MVALCLRLKGFTFVRTRLEIVEKEALRKLQFAHQVTAIENPMKLREARKLVARLHTELKAKELQEENDKVKGLYGKEEKLVLEYIDKQYKNKQSEQDMDRNFISMDLSPTREHPPKKFLSQ